MNSFIEHYKIFKENEINISFQNDLAKLKENRDSAISKLNLIDNVLNYKSEAKFLYTSAIGFKFIQDNPKYSKLFLQGFLEDNLNLITFGDLKIYDHNNQKSSSFRGRLFNEINEVYNTSDLEEGDRVIILEEFSLLESMIATVLPIVRGVYKLEGTPLINNGIIRSTDGFKKLYGKNFNIFKLI